jgi:hypothetical protein
MAIRLVPVTDGSARPLGTTATMDDVAAGAGATASAWSGQALPPVLEPSRAVAPGQ